ncbi:hypothetical protein CBF34_02375 [Vagococcus penaei]|uniref:Uncharacterized protein n=1 Tax=Vagococcus penaei TaxID=633807 RepID=A0A1Q2D800_9ENTE|nr:hypothetical protein [Vagococcus penaei]AQP54467.1 hypothetical protein BW732_09680 [Vagococcus penaei]RSU06386.1 hypothetical protein CBF34_02375 [Vagococcus penaei]
MKRNMLLIIMSLLFLTACTNQKQANQSTTDTSMKTAESAARETTSIKKRQYVVNNMLIGQSKISFNNQDFAQLSDGKFTKSVLWGTFRSDKYPNISLQLNAADKEQKIYGDINGYELEDIDWDVASPVQYVNVMEEALQFSKDKKALLYKARTGDIIFSVAFFSDSELTSQEILALKKISKSISIEYVGDTLTE